MKILEENEEWNYDSALAAGIQMHLALASSFSMTTNDMVEFFTKICRMWDMAVINRIGIKDVNEIEMKRENLWESFEDGYEKQKKMLNDFTRILLEVFTSKSEIDNEWLNTWLKDTHLISQKIINAMNKKLVIIPSWFKVDHGISASEEKQALWSILYSYVHMTNNRLGIQNRDEAFIAYLIKRSLESSQ